MLLIILSHFAHQSCKSGPRSVLGGFIPCWGIEKPLCPYILRKLDYLKQWHLKKKNPGSLQTQNFAKWLWLLAIFHKPLVCEGLWKIAKTLKKMSFKGLEKLLRNIFYNLLLWDLAYLPLYIGRIYVNCQWVSDV